MGHSPYTPPCEATPLGTTRNPPATRPIAGRALGVTSLVSAAMFACWAILLSSGASIFLVVILGLIASPYVILWLATRALTGSVGIVLIAITLIGCIWFGAKAFDAVNEDAQGGLNLVFAPVFQLGGALCSMCLAVTLDSVERKVRAALSVRQNGG